jgi:branched-chain amino acid transport system permease protein
MGIFWLVIASLVPWVLDTSLQVTAITVSIYVMLALGLNIVVGYAGLLDLGYVAFDVIGAYTMAAGSFGFIQLANGDTKAVPSFPFWVLLPVGAILAGFFGVLLGAPTLRLRGDYLAIVTLGFGEIVPIVFNNVPYFFGPVGIVPGAVLLSDPSDCRADYSGGALAPWIEPGSSLGRHPRR